MESIRTPSSSEYQNMYAVQQRLLHSKVLVNSAASPSPFSLPPLYFQNKNCDASVSFSVSSSSVARSPETSSSSIEEEDENEDKFMNGEYLRLSRIPTYASVIPPKIRQLPPLPPLLSPSLSPYSSLSSSSFSHSSSSLSSLPHLSRFETTPLSLGVSSLSVSSSYPSNPPASSSSLFLAPLSVYTPPSSSSSSFSSPSSSISSCSLTSAAAAGNLPPLFLPRPLFFTDGLHGATPENVCINVASTEEEEEIEMRRRSDGSKLLKSSFSHSTSANAIAIPLIGMLLSIFFPPAGCVVFCMNLGAPDDSPRYKWAVRSLYLGSLLSFVYSLLLSMLLSEFYLYNLDSNLQYGFSYSS